VPTSSALFACLSQSETEAKAKSVQPFRILVAFASVLTLAGAMTARAQSAPLPTLPITQLDVRQTDPDLDGRRVSLAFPRPTPVRDVLIRLVRNTRLSVIADPAVAQAFVGELKNVSVREALDVIVEPLGLDYIVRGQVIRVFPRERETRFYNVDYVITQRTARDSPNLYADLTEGIRSLLSEGGRMSLDRTAALLGVTDTPDRLAKVEQYLEAVMLRATRQVQIEARVIEVELREEFSAGIDWRLVVSALTATPPVTPGPPGSATLAIKASDYSALLRALAAQGTVDVLSSPRITAMNNEPAVMRVRTHDVYFIATSQVDPSGRILQTTATPHSVTEGITLSVTPQISVDGVIHLSITPTIAQRTGVATSRSGETVPVISVREADTLARVRQGETIVIAGLMQDREAAGSAKHLKTDLVILLTPTLMAR